MVGLDTEFVSMAWKTGTDCANLTEQHRIEQHKIKIWHLAGKHFQTILSNKVLVDRYYSMWKLWTAASSAAAAAPAAAAADPFRFDVWKALRMLVCLVFYPRGGIHDAHNQCWGIQVCKSWCSTPMWSWTAHGFKNYINHLKWAISCSYRMPVSRSKWHCCLYWGPGSPHSRKKSSVCTGLFNLLVSKWSTVVFWMRHWLGNCHANLWSFAGGKFV